MQLKAELDPAALYRTYALDMSAQVMVYSAGQLQVISLSDFTQSLISNGLVMSPLPSSIGSYSDHSDADLIMEALSRGYVIQKGGS